EAAYTGDELRCRVPFEQADLTLIQRSPDRVIFLRVAIPFLLDGVVSGRASIVTAQLHRLARGGIRAPHAHEDTPHGATGRWAHCCVYTWLPIMSVCACAWGG